MATKIISKKEADAAKKEIFALLLKKIGVTTNRFYEVARNNFVANNLDLLTPEEKKHYKEKGLSLWVGTRYRLAYRELPT